MITSIILINTTILIIAISTFLLNDQSSSSKIKAPQIKNLISSDSDWESLSIFVILTFHTAATHPVLFSQI